MGEIMNMIFKAPIQQKLDTITTGAAQIANQPSPLIPVYRPPTTSPVSSGGGNTTKTTADNTGGKVEVVKEADYNTLSGWDYLSLLFGIPGALYLGGETIAHYSNKPDKTSTAYTGSKDDIIDLIKKTAPEPTTPAATTGGSSGGLDVGGILDKVIIAAVVVGGISLLKGVFK